MFAFGRVKDIKTGVELAREMIESGQALVKLNQFIKISNRV